LVFSPEEAKGKVFPSRKNYFLRYCSFLDAFRGLGVLLQIPEKKALTTIRQFGEAAFKALSKTPDNGVQDASTTMGPDL